MENWKTEIKLLGMNWKRFPSAEDRNTPEELQFLAGLLVNPSPIESWVEGYWSIKGVLSPFQYNRPRLELAIRDECHNRTSCAAYQDREMRCPECPGEWADLLCSMRVKQQREIDRKKGAT